MPARAKAPEWKTDPEAAMTRLFEGLPRAPSLAQAQRVTPFMGMMEYPNLHRSVSKPGLALIGDAALSIDPLWGIGCGWALQSAEWLAGAVGRAWTNPAELDRGLSAYAKRHRSELDRGVDVIAALVLIHVVPVADVVDGGPAWRAGAAQRDLVVFGAVLRGGAQELAVNELGVVAGLAVVARED